MPLPLTTDILRTTAQYALDRARRGGADAAEAEVSQGSGLHVTVRMGKLETLEYTGDQSLSVTVYVAGCKGQASTTDFSPSAVAATVDKALTIARYTQPDPFAGLADPERLAGSIPDLDLYHPWALEVPAAEALAHACEAAAFAVDPRIDNSEGATVSSNENEFVYANTHGFMGGYRHTGHWLSCAVVASAGEAMERDDHYTSHRLPGQLETAETVGRRAGEKAVARLNPRKLATQQAPVLFTPEMASGFIGHGMSALYGGALYRKSSFLLDSLDQAVFAPIVHIREEPLLPQAYASAPFDQEGVACQPRAVVEAGVIRGYFLSSYSARKLGMTTTGNAGGHHNLLVAPTTEADLMGLARQMRRGLIVTELMGQGVNPVTGDYSRGAAGFWVEDGAIAYPVSEITIAGNLRDLYRRIVAIGSDIDRRGSRHVGSILIESMQIAGD